MVPVYNIPELKALGLPLVLSRATLVGIYLGSIRKWNDTRVLNDNAQPSVKAALASISSNIKVIVRADSSGTTEIFSTALSSFDPATGKSVDYSFTSTVGFGQTPTWQVTYL